MSDAIRYACFGRFALDLVTLELIHDGHPVPLPPQPARVLSLLVQNAGRLVTREDLRAALWPDSVVDYQKGLNTAVRQVRDALGEHANVPVFVETLPRRGYRFIAQVTAYDALPAPPLLTAPATRRGEPSAEAPRTIVSLRSRRWASAAGLALAILVAAVLGRRLLSGDPPAVRLLVLPFANLTADPDNAPLIGGLTEDVRAHLSTIAPGRLVVLARTTAERYPFGTVGLATVRDELDVDYVLEGSVSTGTNGLRLIARLVATADERPVWRGAFEGSGFEDPRWRGDLGRGVTRIVGLAEVPQAPDPEPKAIAPGGRLAYLKARYLLGTRNPDDVAGAASLFAEALETDADFALAWSGLAEARFRMGDLVAARRAAGQALDLDPYLAEAHRVVGAVLLVGDRDLAGSRPHFERAVAASPALPENHQAYAFYLFLAGEPEAGIAQAQTAYELDPLSAALNGDVGVFYLWAGDPERAYERCSLAAELDNEHVWAYRCLVAALEMMDRDDRILLYLRHLMVLEGADSADVRSVTRSGPRDAPSAYRRWRIERLEAGSGEPTGADRLQLARLYAAEGDLDRAVASLEAAASDPPLGFAAVSVDPTFRPLAEHPRFRHLLSTLWLD